MLQEMSPKDAIAAWVAGPGYPVVRTGAVGSLGKRLDAAEKAREAKLIVDQLLERSVGDRRRSADDANIGRYKNY